jgi:hypothetical protein
MQDEEPNGGPFAAQDRAWPPAANSGAPHGSQPSEDYDDDDDDDNWSRQVETDEVSHHHQTLGSDEGNTAAANNNNNNPTTTTTTHNNNNAATATLNRTMESVAELEEEDDDGVQRQQQQRAQPPSQPALSLKDEAIARERQRRVETERARLKRQFALSNQQQQMQSTTSSGGGDNNNNANHNHHTGESTGGGDAAGDAASVAHSIESTMVHPDQDNADNPEMRLGFNMERFLRNSEDFCPTDDADTHTAGAPVLLMERFLQAPVEVGEAAASMPSQGGSAADAAARSVSFEAAQHSHTTATSHDHLDDDTTTNGPPSAMPDPSRAYSSFEEDTTANMSVQVHADEDTVHEEDNEDRDTDGPTGLTEADVEALVATEEASIANAPPSERDELLSEVGELADHFAAAGVRGGDLSLLSQGTPTTAMESDKAASSAVSSDKQSDGAAPTSMLAAAAVANHDTMMTAATVAMNVLPPTSTADSQDVLGLDQILGSDGRPGTPPMSNQSVLDAARPTPYGGDVLTPSSPHVDRAFARNVDAFTPWSPPGKMNVSPLHHPRRTARTPDTDLLPSMPVTTDRDAPASEVTPLLDVPPEIITTRNASEIASLDVVANRWIQSMWQDLGESQGSTRKRQREQVSSSYTAAKSLERAIPGRLLSLIVTLAVLLPIWAMLTLAAPHICAAVGRHRMTLWLAMVPVHLGVSSHIGLQASHVSTDAVSFRHVTLQGWATFWRTEVATGVVLGAVLGAVLGVMMLVVGDWQLAAAVLVAQVASSTLAALVGPVVPWLATWLQRYESTNLWTAPLVTALVDLTCTIAWISVSILVLRPGSSDVDEMDTCS